ncbi:MAG: hypothetical protein NUV32_09445 [Exilispira sp.]|jgi:hypothetical protein|nr:hypothetical protein [Exilispira sp.]
MNRRLISIFVLLLIISIVSQMVLGQNISFSFSPRLWGLDFYLFLNDFPAKLGDFATIQMILGIGGGWESYGYFRDTSNNPLPYSENSPYAFYFNRIDLIGTFGLGFLFFYNEFYGKYTSQLRFKFLVDYQSYEQDSDGKPTLLSQTNLPDKEGIFQNSFAIELYIDFLKYSSKYHTIRGMDLLVSYEIFPQFINEIANFSRIQVKLRGFLTILENDNLSIYLADRVYFYYIPQTSSYIPISALTMGSLGYSMRGINWCQYEGTIRLLNNFDIRIFLPQIFGQSYIIPGLILFFDFGTNDYQDLNGVFGFSNLQYSTGIGLVIVALGIDLIDFYLDYNLKESQLYFKLRFSLFF